MKNKINLSEYKDLISLSKDELIEIDGGAR
jgi:hypothetical protein